MLHYIYSRPLIVIILFMVLVIVVCGGLSAYVATRHWRRGNLILAIFVAATILYATILTRSEGSTGLILTPFAALTAARIQPEIYREMLMNVFLFFPLGLTLSNALPQKWHRWVRIILTTLIGCALSAGIEYAQYRYALGLAETDDVICNTLGAFLGAASLLAAHAIEKTQRKGLAHEYDPDRHGETISSYRQGCRFRRGAPR